MSVFDQLLQVPYALILLPIVVFLGIIGTFYMLLRPAPAVSEAAEAPAPAAAAPEKSKEQRAGVRRNGNPIEVLVAPPDEKKQPGVGSVLDRSIGGLRLAVFHEIETGTVLSVRPTLSETIVPWIDVEVRSCKPSTEMPGQFEVGCQYVKSPPYSIQLLFG